MLSYYLFAKLFMTKIIHQPNDKLFKKSFSDIRVAKDFFLAHLPSALLQKIDLDTLKKQPHSFIDNSFKSTEADIIYQAKLGDSYAYLYLLCEHQSVVEQVMAFRLLVYMIRIIELHREQHPKSSLPIVYPIVIYTGEPLWSAPREIFELFFEKELAKQLWLQPYQLIDVCRISDDELRQEFWSGLVAFVFKHRKVQDLANFLKIIFGWIGDIANQGGENFAKNVLEYLVKETEIKDGSLFIEIAQQCLSEDLREKAMTLSEWFEQRGEIKGEINGERKLLLKLLQRKFGNLSPYHQLQLETADAEKLMYWGEAILDAKSLDEVFGSVAC